MASLVSQTRWFVCIWTLAADVPSKAAWQHSSYLPGVLLWHSSTLCSIFKRVRLQ